MLGDKLNTKMDVSDWPIERYKGPPLSHLMDYQIFRHRARSTP